MSSAISPISQWDALRRLALRLSEARVTELLLSESGELEPRLRELVEAGVLIEDRGSVRFFHETMYDHVLARAFVEDDRPLIDEVLSKRQDLSRRALVRQVLTFQRGVDRPAYLVSARSLIEHPNVRFHLRDVPT